MSEKFNSKSNETLPSRESHQEQLKDSHDKEPSKQEQEHGKAEHVETHRNKVEQLARSAEELSPAKAEHAQQNQHPVLINKQLKDVAFTRAITRARKRLSAPSRVLSKIVHQPAIDATSEFVGKTVARPSGMLGGAIVAFIGSSLLLWITRHYGYEYNYLAVVLLFAIGLFLGLGVEFVWRLVRKRES